MRRILGVFLWLVSLWFASLPVALSAQSIPWGEQRAAEWYARQPWYVGSNYIPSTAINQLEMWQAETFDPQRIDQELGWAEAIGLNAMRVFLQDLLWQQDPAGFQKRIDTFLKIAARHHIKVIFVLFDSCWDPQPHLGPQRAPRPGVHNSGWVQSPGAAALKDASQYPRLEAYVTGVVSAFGNDPRVIAWDVWNEPSNTNKGSYDQQEVAEKKHLVLELLPKVFRWARQAGASQPLTSGLWEGNWSSVQKMDPITRVQLEQSDIVSFHNYDAPKVFQRHLRWLQHYHRPILCTEYMARPRRSTFANILPIAKKYKIAAINWGLVAGKTQTYLPWDSWRHPYTAEQPKEWFHEIFRTDGQPYRQSEVDLIRKLTVVAGSPEVATTGK
jgi:Cellulase (glycosyl hydrolase family 5)